MKDGWGRRVKILKPVVEKAMFSESIYKLILVNRKSASVKWQRKAEFYLKYDQD